MLLDKYIKAEPQNITIKLIKDCAFLKRFKWTVNFFKNRIIKGQVSYFWNETQMNSNGISISIFVFLYEWNTRRKQGRLVNVNCVMSSSTGNYRLMHSIVNNILYILLSGLCYDRQIDLQLSSVHRSLPASMQSILIFVLFTPQVECLRFLYRFEKHRAWLLVGHLTVFMETHHWKSTASIINR